MLSYDFELTITGLCVLTFHGEDKRRPDEVNVLLVKTDPPRECSDAEHSEHSEHAGHSGHEHPQHFPLLTFSVARETRPAAGSNAEFGLVPTPDGRQLGIVRLEGPVHLNLGDGDGPAGLTARWRPADLADRLAPEDEEAWLNWVPLLKKVSPDLKAPTEEAPFAGLNWDRVIATLKLTRGALKAANLIRRADGRLAIWEFKPAGKVEPFARQAMAAAVVLRLSGLSQPVSIEGDRIGRLRLVGRQGELVRASVTNLPAENSAPSERLEHFAQFYDLFEEQPQTESLPEFTGIIDTSQGMDCPCAVHTVVPDGLT